MCHMNSFRSSIAPWTSARYHPLRRRGLGETLLLLHGNPAWCFLYRKIIAAVKRDFRCVALDYPATECRARRPATASPRVSTRLFSDDLQTNPASLTTTLAALFRPSYVCRERTSSYIAPDVMKL